MGVGSHHIYMSFLHSKGEYYTEHVHQRVESRDHHRILPVTLSHKKPYGFPLVFIPHSGISYFGKSQLP